jgi:hypothetical protein
MPLYLPAGKRAVCRQRCAYEKERGIVMWFELLMVSIGAAVMPLWLIMALLLLPGEGGLGKAAAFAAGAAAMRLLQGVLFGMVFSGVPAGDGRGALVSTLLLVLGLLLLSVAYRKWRKEEDPDESPKWMSKLSGMSLPKAFGAGALLMLIAMKHWVFTLSAIGVIEAAQPGLATAVLAYLGFVLLAQVLLLLPIAAYALAPAPTGKLLSTADRFLQRHNRTISIAISLIFGAWFLWQGVTGMLA